jgi:hypothetical protein
MIETAILSRQGLRGRALMELWRRLRERAEALLDGLVPPGQTVAPLPPEWFKFPPI